MKVPIANLIFAAFVGGALLVVSAQAQAPGRGAAPNPPAPAGRGGGGGGGGAAYPQRPPADPAVLARGKAIYDVNCAFCHGSDARGGDLGPNLIRTQVLLNDKNGELLTPELQNGRPDQGMPKFEFSATQISDIAAFIHSFRVAGYDGSRNRPETIVVGDAKAGQAYFQTACASCHSASGDLIGLGARITDPRTLQQRWLMPTGGGRGGAPAAPTTVTVTLASGQKIEGRLVRIDDFLVALTDSDGAPRSFRRDGNVPRVEVHDPIQAHRDLLRAYTDKNIHDVTAYLVTLK